MLFVDRCGIGDGDGSEEAGGCESTVGRGGGSGMDCNLSFMLDSF